MCAITLRTGESLLRLDAFVRENVVACSRLGADYDARLVSGSVPLTAGGAPVRDELHPSQEYIFITESMIMSAHELEPLLLALSDVYDHIRQLTTQRDNAVTAPKQPVENAATSDEKRSAATQQHVPVVQFSLPSFGGAIPPSPKGRCNNSVVCQDQPPTHFRRKTTKFWVHPASALRLKLLIMRHLPIHVFDDRPRLAFGRQTAQAAARDICGSSLVSSVYFDDSAMSVYHQRLSRPDGATVVRARWYGVRAAGDPEQPVFVECKVHRESWTGEASIKQRAPMTQGALERFLAAGELPASASAPESAVLLRKMYDFLQARSPPPPASSHQQAQLPLLRTQYRRTAFQARGCSDVRVSLDVELCMFRECGGQNAWCRDLSRCGSRCCRRQSPPV